MGGSPAHAAALRLAGAITGWPSLGHPLTSQGTIRVQRAASGQCLRQDPLPLLVLTVTEAPHTCKATAFHTLFLWPASSWSPQPLTWCLNLCPYPAVSVHATKRGASHAICWQRRHSAPGTRMCSIVMSNVSLHPVGHRAHPLPGSHHVNPWANQRQESRTLRDCMSPLATITRTAKSP